jgi:hypothetical protein
MKKKKRSTISSLFHWIMMVPSMAIIAASPIFGFELTKEYFQVTLGLPYVFAILLGIIGGAVAFVVAMFIFGRFLPEFSFKGPTTR